MFTREELTTPQTKLALEKLICEKSFYQFVKRAWNNIDPDLYIDNWHIECLCVHLQAQYESNQFEILDITLPPGCGKSMVCSVLFPVWLWIKEPKLRLLTGSHSMDFAIRDTLKSRNLINTNWFQNLWSNKFKLAADQNLKKNYANDQGGFRMAISTTGTTGARGDLILFDDAMSVTQAASDVERVSVNTYMRQTLFNRQNIMRDTKICIIGQRLHHNDYHSFYLSLPNCFHIDLPIEFEVNHAFVSPMYKDPRTEEKEILFKIPKFQGENLTILKEVMGARGWATQYQQKPSIPEGNILLRSYWKYYKPEELPPYLKKISGWDFAAKDGEQNDYTAGITMGKDGKKFYVLGLYHKKVRFVQAKKDYIKECEMHKPIKRYVEDTSNGMAIIDEMKTTTYVTTPVSPKGKNKVARVEPISPIFEAGCVYLPFNEPWTEVIIEECANFPNGEHDDIVDAIAIVLNNERFNIMPEFAYV